MASPVVAMRTEAVSLDVMEETGVLSVDGQQRTHSLFLPAGSSTGSEGLEQQRPALLFVHGFLRDRSKHFGLARRLCRALGAVVMVPDIGPLQAFGGAEMQAAAVREVAAHAECLARRADVDASALFLGGFSAGGAAALEAAACLQQEGSLRPSGLVLLDPVPWPSTSAAAERLAPLPSGLLVLQTQPSMLNSFGAFCQEIVPKLAATHGSLLQGPSTWSSPGSPLVLTVAGAGHMEAEAAGADAAESGGGGLFDLISLFGGEVKPERARYFFVLLEAFLLQALSPDRPREDRAGDASGGQGAKTCGDGQQPSSGLAALRRRLGAALSLADGHVAPETPPAQACNVQLVLHASTSFFLWQSLCIHSSSC